MIDLDKDKTAQGIGAVLLAAAAWLFTKLRVASKEERPVINGQRQRLIDALVELQTENTQLKGRVVKLELEMALESENARREHLRLHTRIREMEFRLQNLLDEQSTP